MQRLGTLIRFLFHLSGVVSEDGFSISREREEIAGCVIGVVGCWTGVVGMDVQGVGLVDSPLESFSREIIGTSKWSITL